MRRLAFGVWLLIMALGDSAVIVNSTTHNPTATTLGIAAAMLAADLAVTAGYFVLTGADLW